jgi:hypothetical protein
MKATLRLADGELVALLEDGRELKNFDAEILAGLLWNSGVSASELEAVDWHTDVMSAPTSGQKIAIFSRLRKFEGVSCEEQIQEGRERTISKLLDMPIWISRADLSRLKRHKGEGTEQIDHWINERKIFAVEGGGLQLFAKFQFDDAYSPLPVIAKILELLKSKDDWAVASWFAFPNGWISSHRAEACESLPPMYALDDEAAVIRAAQNELGTYFA